MPELRLTLMIVGLIFLIGLTWWELRRPHQARGSDLQRPGPEPLERLPERSMEWDTAPLELPRMSARDPEGPLPVVEVDSVEFAVLEAEAYRLDPGANPGEPESGGAAKDMPTLMPPTGGVEGLLAELGANQMPDPPISEIIEPFQTVAMEAAPEEPEESEGIDEIDEPEEPEDSEMSGLPAVPAALGAPAEPVVVDWPTADASQVIAVRLVSDADRFPGRAVRLALAAEGFVLGKFSIFHKPAADGRALLSIASLNKPGTFEIHGMDVQRYSGLNLFTVLPGPIPGPEAVDELLACAQVLSQRLRGSLRDGKGELLTPSRTAHMRSAAAASPT